MQTGLQRSCSVFCGYKTGQDRSLGNNLFYTKYIQFIYFIQCTSVVICETNQFLSKCGNFGLMFSIRKMAAWVFTHLRRKYNHCICVKNAHQRVYISKESVKCEIFVEIRAVSMMYQPKLHISYAYWGYIYNLLLLGLIHKLNEHKTPSFVQNLNAYLMKIVLH